MGSDFAPYLNEVVPSLFHLAQLNPEMAVEGKAEGEMQNILNEVRASKDDKVSITTSEIEEKSDAIKMISVFVEELGGAYAPFIEQTSAIMLSLADYDLNDDIRNTVATSFGSLIKSAKEGGVSQDAIQQMAAKYIQTLWKAIKSESETETLVIQTQAIKEIIEEVPPFMQTADIQDIATQILDLFKQSDERKEKNEKLIRERHEDNEDQDDEDIDLVQEENQSENELQISLTEIFGAIFKTHGQLCADLVTLLNTQLVAKVLVDNASEQHHKVGIFVLCDMVEHLPAQLVSGYLNDIA